MKTYAMVAKAVLQESPGVLCLHGISRSAISFPGAEGNAPSHEEDRTMTIFDDREKAFEDKYKHDQELQFRVEVRRNKLLGLWAAELLGKDDAEAYAKEVISADFAEPGGADLVRKILADLQDGGVEMSEHRLRKKMEECLAEAKEQVMKE